MTRPESIDLADVLAKRLREAGYDDAKVRKLDAVKDGGIAVRRMPSTCDATYYGGGRSLQYVVQVVVARESELEAIDQCCAIAEMAPELDLASDNGSYGLTSIEVYTEPQELESEPLSVWETRLRANINVRS